MPIVAPTIVDSLLALARETTETSSSSCGGTCIRNWKIGFTTLLVVEGIAFAFLIFGLRRFFARSPGHIDKLSHYSHAVSGGIFLATGFMHLLPDAIELLAGGHGEHDEGEHNEEGEPHSDHHVRVIRALVKLAVREEGDQEHDDGHDDEHGEKEGHKFEFSWAMFTVLMAFYFLFFIEKIVVPAVIRRTRDRAAAKMGDAAADKLAKGESCLEGCHDHDIIAPEDIVTEEIEGNTLPGVFSLPFAVGLTHVVALSAHAVFEATSLGLASSFATTLNIFIAVASHRWAVALAISVPLARRVSHFAFSLLIGIFSVVPPIGVAIGAVLSNVSATTKGVLFAVSAGTFLYVGVVECLGAAFSSHKKANHTALFLTTLLGSGFMFATTAMLAAAGVEHAD